MKTIILLLTIIFTISLFSCKNCKEDNKSFTIKMYFVDGHTKTATYILPISSKIYVSGSHTYSLNYICDCSNSEHSIRKGVIDYEIIN